MIGKDLENWRLGKGWSRSKLMQELGVKSRQTMANWENSETELPKMVVLAMWALDHQPEHQALSDKTRKLAMALDETHSFQSKADP